jgi:serine/threonine-protein kinase
MTIRAPVPKWPEAVTRSSEIERSLVLGSALGEGGMGRVQLARLVGLGGFERLVAVKRLLPRLASDSSLVALFLAEARYSALVAHPGVVSVEDVVLVDDSPCHVMPFVPGVNLATLLDDAGGPLPPTIATALLVDLLAALRAVHAGCDASGERLDLVHGDVAAENVLVGADMRTRLVDFGLATCRHARATRGRPRGGRLASMAPEQLLGRGFDARADLFAVGVLGWRLFTGEAPFDGTSARERLASIRRGPPKVSRALGVPAGALEVMSRALEWSPSDRPGSADELARALTAATTCEEPLKLADWGATYVKPRVDVDRRSSRSGSADDTTLAAPELAAGSPWARSLSRGDG